MRIRSAILSVMCLLVVGLSIGAQTKSVVKQAVAPDAPQLRAATEYRYQLVAGDVLDVSYRYTPEFNQTVMVQPDGYVVLQIVGDVKIGGLTIEQARQEIIKKATVRLKDPEITLVLKEFQKPYYVVAGEVGQPGKVEMREKTTALQAVMMAGGFKDSARSSQIVIFRKLNEQMAEVKTLDLRSIKRTSDLENDLTLEPGDIVFVPRNTFSKVEKFIRLTSIASILTPIIP